MSAKSKTSPSLITENIINDIFALSTPEKIVFYTHFFRADVGDICFGDKFLAIKVPEIRKLIKKYINQLEIADTKVFLESKYNDIRFFGIATLGDKYYKTKDVSEKFQIVTFLIENIKAINHWNLVDVISSVFSNYCLLVGNFKMLVDFSVNESIWIRRIAIVSCLQLIKTGNYIDLVLEIVTNNIGQKHEYIHKAMGWILRELGKKYEQILIDYLQRNWLNLAPATRSYATERLRKTRDIKLLFKT